MCEPEVVASYLFLVTFYPYFLKQAFSASLQLTDLDRPAGQCVLGIPVSLPHQGWKCKQMLPFRVFNVGSS